MPKTDSASSQDPHITAYALYGKQETRPFGAILLATRANREGLYTLANHYLNDVSLEYMVKYNLLTAVETLSRENPPRFSQLVDVLLQSPGQVHGKAIAQACYALLYQGDSVRAEALYTLYRDVCQLESEEEQGIFRGLEIYLEKRKTCASSSPAPAGVHLGLLSYRTPNSYMSCNVGDYIQTMGMVGAMLEAGIRPTGAGDRECAFLEELAARFPKEKEAGKANFFVVDRDDLRSPPISEPVWVPIFGWMAHPRFNRSFELDLPPTIRPLFISLHLAEAEFLSPDNIALLQRYSPVGCRDYTTVRILRSAGIPAFFSGCVTSMLGALYKRSQITPHRYSVSHGGKGIHTRRNEEAVCHSLPEIRHLEFSAAMHLADMFLTRYMTAEHVRTNLLHCLMPCRAMGTPVAFVHKKPGDRRFEGLIDATPEDIALMKKRFRTVLGGTLRAIVSGLSEEQVYATWRELCQPELERTTAYLQECPQFVPPASDISPTALRERVRTTTMGPASGDDSLAHICFAIDPNHLVNLLTSARAVLAHSGQPLHLHILTRDIAPEQLSSLANHPRCRSLTQYDCSTITYATTAMKLLPHTSVATMDRLMIPELLQDIPKAIYLDTDVLVRKDIQELWAIDPGDCLLAARASLHREWYRGLALSLEVPEAYNAERAKLLRTHLYATGTLDFPCFNAGVLVMNLARMRESALTAYTMALATEFGLHDQYCLNIAVRGAFAPLPMEWNYFYNQEIHEDPALVHYAGPWKPWDYPQLPHGEEWAGYQNSPVAG